MALFENNSKKKNAIMPPVERPRPQIPPQDLDHPSQEYGERGHFEPSVQHRDGFNPHEEAMLRAMEANKLKRIAEDIRALTYKEMIEFALALIKVDDGKVIKEDNSQYAVADFLNKWAHNEGEVHTEIHDEEHE